jgi:hypothetical protein
MFALPIVDVEISNFQIARIDPIGSTEWCSFRASKVTTASAREGRWTLSVIGYLCFVA